VILFDHENGKKIPDNMSAKRVKNETKGKRKEEE